MHNDLDRAQAMAQEAEETIEQFAAWKIKRGSMSVLCFSMHITR